MVAVVHFYSIGGGSVAAPVLGQILSYISTCLPQGGATVLEDRCGNEPDGA